MPAIYFAIQTPDGFFFRREESRIVDLPVEGQIQAFRAHTEELFFTTTRVVRHWDEGEIYIYLAPDPVAHRLSFPTSEQLREAEFKSENDD